MPKYKKLALKLGIQTYQIVINDDEVCIPSLSSILLAVRIPWDQSLKTNYLDTVKLCSRCKFLLNVFIYEIFPIFS